MHTMAPGGEFWQSMFNQIHALFVNTNGVRQPASIATDDFKPKLMKAAQQMHNLGQSLCEIMERFVGGRCVQKRRVPASRLADQLKQK